MARRLLAEYLLRSSVAKTLLPFIVGSGSGIYYLAHGDSLSFLSPSNCHASSVDSVPVLQIILQASDFPLRRGFSGIGVSFTMGFSSIVSLKFRFSRFTQQHETSLEEPFSSQLLPLFRQPDHQPPQHIPPHMLIVLRFLIQSPDVLVKAKVKTT